jgi:Peroxiredoxin
MDLPFDVTPLPANSSPAVGDPLPGAEVTMVTAETWQAGHFPPQDAAGPVTVVFHPMIGSFPTTYLYAGLSEAGVTEQSQVVGVTVSDPYAIASFLRGHGYPVAIASDPTCAMAEATDLSLEVDGLPGLEAHRPAVFVTAADGTIQYRWVAEEWPEFPAYDEIADAVSTVRGGR